MFKRGVVDDHDRLSTWSSEEDCCAWSGVECSNITHRVTKLDLQPKNYVDYFKPLKDLDLSHNMFYGSYPSTLANLSSLVSLRIGSNSLSGGISQTIFSNLPNLEVLDLSNLTFAFHFHPDFIPPFQLGWLDMSNTNQGPYFPSWIYTQKLLYSLDISNSRISFIDEYKFGSLIAGIEFLQLSNNSIRGDISNVTLNATEIYLDHNNFTASLPHISPNASHVDLSYNSFSGPIPCSWKNFKNLEFINLWSNQLSGEVPTDLSNWTQVLVLNLGKNKLSGTIPIKMPQNLQVMILRSNQFEGNIPPQIFNLSFLCHLDLAHNNLSGSIPHSAYNMTQMIKDKTDTWYINSIIDLFTKADGYLIKASLLLEAAH
ncbi:hypothetical protein VNO77_42906 [Canavalia gladiata]|uniref:Leucine-rich repeat-containing N-terminal plant-type domain-containing protein n=1 Tax=Canavalia gladiata TaxID=3824 RepID=A0AAN9JVK7_CANGL